MTSAQRAGSLFMTDHPTDPIEIDCQKCGRHGRYRKATLIEKYGRDTVLPDLLALMPLTVNSGQARQPRLRGYLSGPWSGQEA